MAEIAYTVTVTFTDAEVAASWLDWLRGGHVGEVLKNGANRAEIVAVEGGPLAFEVRYRFPSREAFAAYERDHAPRLRAEAAKLYPPEKGVVYQRAVGELTDVWSHDSGAP